MTEKDTSKRFDLSREQKELLDQLMQEEGISRDQEARGPVGPVNEWPLASIQERLWFMEQLSPESAFYSISQISRIVGPLDVPLLKRCIDEIIRRHEILRVSFIARGERSIQVVAPSLSLTIPVLDFRHLPESAREARALQVANEEVNKPFQLAHGPLIRVTLIQVAEERFLSVMTAHHAIIDGWGWGIFTAELVVLYNAFSEAKASPLPELTHQFVDYVHWEHQRLQGQALEQLLTYWRQQISGAPTTLLLPTDHPRPAVQTFKGDQHILTLPQTLVDALDRLGQREDATRFMTLLAAYNVLFCRYTGQEDILVGFSSWGRGRTWMEGLIGNFVNILVLRTRLAGNPSFREVVRRVRGVVLDAIDHQDLPFEKLIEALHLERNTSRNQLLQVMIGSMLVDDQASTPLANLTVQNIYPETKTVSCDIELYICEVEDGVKCIFEYNVDLFERKTIELFAERYRMLLESVVQNVNQRIGEIQLLTASEQQALRDSSQALQNPSSPRFIDELFSQQAARTPAAPALVCGKQQISYGELEAQSNQLAHYLQKIGVKPEVPVGLFVERSIEMVVGLLGILKAGGAYVPLDPMYPRERLSFMLSDAHVSVLVTQTQWLDRVLLPVQAQLVCLDTDWSRITQESQAALARTGSAENLAYITYTSGSTGKPKGVLGTHRGVINYLTFLARTYQITAEDRILQLASVSFDASMRDLIGPLTVGAQVVLVDAQQLKDAAALLSCLEERQVTGILSIVPSFLTVLAAEQTRVQARTQALRLLLVSGEALYWHTIQAAQTAFGAQMRIVNQYGPTECTMTSTYFPVPEQKGEWETAASGYPATNYQVYLFDRDARPVPAGVAGEVYIGGSGLTRGYLNQPALTAERFVPHPFSQEPGARLYRTGDLARTQADGSLAFLGRIDQQVKLRGFRIELEEIETTLLQHPLVAQCAVIMQEPPAGEKRLVAYIVGVPEAPATSVLTEQVRQDLQVHLPEYMLPSTFVVVEKMPLLPNGKLDRTQLCLLGEEVLTTRAQSVADAPSTPVQQAVAGIWARLLGLERMGVQENFFEVGGHSLLAMQVIAYMRDVFQVELPVAMIFELPTVAEFAEEIEFLGQDMAINVVEIAEMFLQVDQLSEEAVKARLDER